jgi:hypothetical protein
MKYHLDPGDKKVIKEARQGGGVLVTWDRVMRIASGSAITPYEMLDRAKAEGTDSPEAQAEISRMRSLTPSQLTVMGEAADKTWKFFHECIQVTRSSAKKIRQLRVEENYSWRAIAHYWSKKLSTGWGSNQIAGMVICKKAAEWLLEDYMQPPWN